MVLGGVFLGKVVELCGCCEEFLVEVQERLLEDLVFLCKCHPRWFYDLWPFLLNNLTAVFLLLLQDLQGQLRVVVQFLQQIPYLLVVE